MMADGRMLDDLREKLLQFADLVALDLQRVGHLVEDVGQLADLVLGVEVHVHVVVAGGDGLGAVGQLDDGRREPAAQHDGGQDDDQADQQRQVEQAGDADLLGRHDVLDVDADEDLADLLLAEILHGERFDEIAVAARQKAHRLARLDVGRTREDHFAVAVGQGGGERPSLGVEHDLGLALLLDLVGELQVEGDFQHGEALEPERLLVDDRRNGGQAQIAFHEEDAGLADERVALRVQERHLVLVGRRDEAGRRVVVGEDDPAGRVQNLDVGVGKKEVLEFQGHGQVVEVFGVLDDLLQLRQEKRLAHQVAQVFQEHALGHFPGAGDFLVSRLFVALGDGNDGKIEGDDDGEDGDDDQ